MRSGWKRALPTCGLVAGALLQGCATPPPSIQVDLYYDAAQRAPELAAKGRRMCTLAIGTIRDQRKNRETLGYVPSAVLADSLEEWVREGLLSLADYGHRMVDPADDGSGEKGVLLEVGISRVHCRTSTSVLHASVALTIRYLARDAVLGQRVYLGEAMETDPGVFKTNYKFGPARVLAVLNDAFADALTKIETDVRGFCTGE